MQSAEEICSNYSRKEILSVRVVATILDGIILALLYFLILSIFTKFSTNFNVVGGILIISFCFYYLFSEWKYGKTIGKHIVKIRIVNKQFKTPSFIQVFLRSLLRLIELNPKLAGGIPALLAVCFTKNKQRLVIWLPKLM